MNYEPTSHYGIHREFSQLGRTLGPDFGTYRNHSFNSTIDKSEVIDDTRVGFPSIRDSFGYKAWSEILRPYFLGMEIIA